MIDRLAVNLAGAFAKSLLPERSETTTSLAPEVVQGMSSGNGGIPEISNNIRRAPQNFPNLNMFQDGSGGNSGVTGMRGAPTSLNMFQDGSDGNAGITRMRGAPTSLNAFQDGSLGSLGTGIDTGLYSNMPEMMNTEIKRAPPNPFENAAGSAYSGIRETEKYQYIFSPELFQHQPIKPIRLTWPILRRYFRLNFQYKSKCGWISCS